MSYARALRSFPTKKLAKIIIRRKSTRVISYKLYCYCFMPDTYETDMIQCGKCVRWFHFTSVGIEYKHAIPKVWKCPKCQGLQIGSNALAKPIEFTSATASKKA